MIKALICWWFGHKPARWGKGWSTWQHAGRGRYQRVQPCRRCGGVIVEYDPPKETH